MREDLAYLYDERFDDSGKRKKPSELPAGVGFTLVYCPLIHQVTLTRNTLTLILAPPPAPLHAHAHAHAHALT